MKSLIFGMIPETFHYVLIALTYEKQLVIVKNKYRKWEFPGGKREKDETIIDTSKREAWEESGAVIQNIKALGYYNQSIMKML